MKIYFWKYLNTKNLLTESDSYISFANSKEEAIESILNQVNKSWSLYDELVNELNTVEPQIIDNSCSFMIEGRCYLKLFN